MEEIHALDDAEIDEAINNDDLEKIAYWQSILLLNASENQMFIAKGTCKPFDDAEHNPLFRDIRNRKASPIGLYCGVNLMYGIAAATTSDGKATTQDDRKKIDLDQAKKALKIFWGYGASKFPEFEGASMQAYNTVLEKQADIVGRITSFGAAGAENSAKLTAEEIEEIEIKGVSTKVSTITVESYDPRIANKITRKYALIPVTRPIDFPGTSWGYSAGGESDNGHMRLDADGKPIFKDSGKGLVLPVLIAGGR